MFASKNGQFAHVSKLITISEPNNAPSLGGIHSPSYHPLPSPPSLSFTAHYSQHSLTSLHHLHPTNPLSQPCPREASLVARPAATRPRPSRVRPRPVSSSRSVVSTVSSVAATTPSVSVPVLRVSLLPSSVESASFSEPCADACTHCC
jgi:hypothetical protein